MAGARLFSIIFATSILFAGCSSGPEKRTEPSQVETRKALEVELPALDGVDSRERARSTERLQAMGKKMCRAISREIDQRVDCDDTGPGFVCLLRLVGALGGEQAARPLKTTALKRTLDPACRVEAIRSLACSGLKECVEALLECISETEPLPVRLAAAAALALFAEDSAARDSLKTVLASGPDQLRAEAAKSLLSCAEGDMTDVFLPRLLDACAQVRLAAIAYFRHHPDPDASAVLRVISSTDSDMRVVAAAGRAIAEMED